MRLYFIKTEESRRDSEVFNAFVNDLSEHKKSLINEVMFAATLTDCPLFCRMRMLVQKSARDEMAKLSQQGLTNSRHIEQLENRPSRNFRLMSERILTNIQVFYASPEEKIVTQGEPTDDRMFFVNQGSFEV